MPIPVSDSTKETIIQHFKRKRINFDEDSLISVLQNSNKKYDIYWAVIGLRDVGTEKCIPYLKLLKDQELGEFETLTKKEKASRLLELEKLNKAYG